MNILALDTSSRATSCAWMEEGVLRGEFFLNAEITHSQTILPMVDALLESMGRKIEETDLFAVSCGPGSFTGLRIGVGAVKGMALALKKPCAPVSTLYALALNMQGVSGYIVPVMDARASQVYTAAFYSEGGGSESLARLCDDMAIPIDQLLDMLLPFSGKPIVLVGDGAALCRDAFAEKGFHVEIAPSTLLHQRAGSVCVAGRELAEQDNLVDSDTLQPVYLRLPQAERERLAKIESEQGGGESAHE
ncbi:MAG: tRNA (adenosine(37)-N6)-threonylcarbamoyltransferase complex dimerization subunit type 1 TsaB [Oscillospiraceae bacterium]|nr:tRNA (adenosine(37)-N6)-threonylcarbamoyltransferase complex dimerization subunit type 1 TsaB [Oscillospiraceae bacterium]